jgi:hypothetical protein
MKGTIITIKPGSGGQLATPVEDKPTLPVLKAAIGGGYLELIPRFTSIEHQGELCNCVAFCDEDGKMKDLPVNERATILWHQALQRTGHPGLLMPMGRLADYLVGQIAIVIGDDEFMEAL